MPDNDSRDHASGAITAAENSRACIWFDVSSLLKYLSDHSHPSGIQRVTLKVLEAARAEPPQGADIGLVRYDPARRVFSRMSFGEFDAFLAQPRPALGAKSLAATQAKKLLRMIPGRAGAALESLAFLTRNKLARLCNMFSGVFRRQPNRHRNDPVFRAGDTYINLGQFWDSPMSYLSELPACMNDLFIVNFIYDIIPAVHPEWAIQSFADLFCDGLPRVARRSDLLLFSSSSAKVDFSAFSGSARLVPPALATVRFGDTPLAGADARETYKHRLAELGLDRPYVLIVGTIEVRKNHALALAAWKRLAAKHAGRMPDLVFAGRWGWKVNDLRAQLEASGHLDGRVRVLTSPSDSDLDALYRGARFTMFPSLYEGWGLPVAESHAYGKVCVASDSSAIPEAADGLAVLFENGSQESLVKAVEPLLFDDARLQGLEQRIAREFAPVRWSRTWREILEAIRKARAPDREGAAPMDPKPIVH